MQVVAAEARLEAAVRGEVEVLAVGVEDGRAVVGEARGHAGASSGLRVEQEDRVEVVRLALCERDPAAVRAPRRVEAPVRDALADLVPPAAVDIDPAQFHRGVVGQDPLAVGRPLQAVVVRLAVLRELPRLARTVGGSQRQLVAAALVAEVGHPLAVRGPRGPDLVDRGRVRQVAHVALFRGNGEDLAAGGEHRALGVGTEVGAGDPVVGAAVDRAGLVAVVVHRDGHPSRLLRREFEHVQPAAVLVHDGVGAEARVLHVVLVVMGHLAEVAGGGVVGPDLQLAGLVAGEVDRVPVPHGEVLGAGPVGHLGRDVLVEVVDPDVLGHAALVALPGARLAGDAVVGQLPAVGRPAREAAGGQRDHRRQAAVDGNRPELLLAHREARPRALEAHRFAVGLPVDHPVVQGMPGQPPRLAARGGDHVDVVVAVIVAREGDPLAVGGELGLALVAHEPGETSRLAAAGGDRPQVASLHEDDRVAVDVGIAQQTHVLRVEVGCCGAGAGGEQDQSRHQPGTLQHDLSSCLRSPSGGTGRTPVRRRNAVECCSRRGLSPPRQRWNRRSQNPPLATSAAKATGTSPICAPSDTATALPTTVPAAAGAVMWSGRS